PVRELARIHLAVAPPGGPLFLVEILGGSLERVVHELGRVEELLTPVDNMPLALQTHVAHQGHERVEDLGDATAERGRRDVDDPRALERLGELADLSDQLRPADVGVVGKRFACYCDGLEHGARTISNVVCVDSRGRAGDDGLQTTLARALRKWS